MAGNTVKKVDDETSSSASFEDVGAKTETTPTVFKDGEIPDVLYVLKYEDLGGRIVDTVESDKPFDLSSRVAEEETTKKKPVIEIVTFLTAPTKRSSSPRRRRRSRSRSRSVSDYSYYSDDDMPARRDEIKHNREENTEMVIHSKHLKAALRAVVGYYPGSELLSETVRVHAPYCVLVHHMKELELYKLNQPYCHDAEYAAITARHIDVLLNFLRTTLGEQLNTEYARWNQSLAPSATFQWLWLMLKPGEIVYVKDDSHWTPFVVGRVDVQNNMSTGRRSLYVVDCWNLEFMTKKIRRRMHQVRVHHFSGEQKIQSLSIVPARFFGAGAKANAEKQLRLGRLYWELAKKPSYKEYNGDLIDRDGNRTGKLTGRVIVDCEGYDRFRDVTPGQGMRPPPGFRPAQRRGMPPQPMRIPPKDPLPHLKPRCSCDTCRHLGVGEEVGPFAGLEDLDPTKDALPDSELFLHVLSDTIPAFLLAERRWGILDLEHLTDVKPDREAFKYLVLDDEIKLTVKALIGKFASTDGQVSPWPSDFVKNKGEGRIFLLHGSPGVGKTCTAECVAELTHRPLLALTSGDISTNMSSDAVERHLSYFLRLGERYGALVLIDEADVYLEARRTRDLARNGLVSVFLRALEYYRGVLFLTTNRVAAFDPAFTSRIHVALHYKKLGDDERQRIWTHNFERLERDSAGKCYVPLGAREYCLQSEDVRVLRWNGREIRNALQTAVALAETEALEDGVEGVTVGEKHLRAVVKMSKGFKDFMSRKKLAWEEDADDEEEGSDDEEAVESDDDARSYV